MQCILLHTVVYSHTYCPLEKKGVWSVVTLSGAATFGLAFSMAAAAVAEIVLAFCATMSSMSNAFQAENDHERNGNNDTERCLLPSSLGVSATLWKTKCVTNIKNTICNGNE